MRPVDPQGGVAARRQESGERGSTLMEVAIATAIAGLVAAGVAGAFKASIDAQQRQVNRILWQREAETAVRHAADVLRRTGGCLSPDRAPMLDWTADKVTVAYTDPCGDAGFQRDNYTTVTLEVYSGALWEKRVDWSGSTSTTTNRQLAGFARPGGTPGTTILNDAVSRPLFQYFGPPNAQGVPTPPTDPAQIRRVTVSLALDGDADGIEDWTARASVSLWNRP